MATGIGEWKSMDTAPRDGTIVELKCTRGVAPWYGIFQYTNKYTLVPFGTTELMTFTDTESSWRGVPDASRGIASESSFQWREYQGDPCEYRDPTNGFQEDPRYWRQAVARSEGLPLDYFEPKPSVYSRIMSWLGMK